MPMRCLRDACCGVAKELTEVGRFQEARAGMRVLEGCMRSGVHAKRRDPPRSVPSHLSQHLTTAQSVGFITAVVVVPTAFWGSNACQTASAATHLYNTRYRCREAALPHRFSAAHTLAWPSRVFSFSLKPHALHTPAPRSLQKKTSSPLCCESVDGSLAHRLRATGFGRRAGKGTRGANAS